MQRSAGSGAERKQAGRFELLLKVWDADPGTVWVAKETDAAPDGELTFVHDLPFSVGLDEEAADQLVEAWEWTADAKHERVLRPQEPIMDDMGVAVPSPYVEGEPLGSLLRLASVRRLVFPAPAALRVAVDLLEGLSYLHGRAAELSVGPRAIYGGLHPNNVVIGADGAARLLEPGISAAIAHLKAFAEDPKRAAYSPPERLEGDQECDATSDLFCVGILMWEQMLGKRLFGALSYSAVAKKVLSQPIDRLDEVKPAGGAPIDKAVADIVARALERSRADRFQSPGEMLEAIQSCGVEVGSHEDVAKVVEQLAGKALAARKSSVDKALSGGGAHAESSKGPVSSRSSTPGPAKAVARPAKPPAPPAPGGSDAGPRKPPPPRVGGGPPLPPRAKPAQGPRPNLPPKRPAAAGAEIADPQTFEGDLVDESPAPPRPGAPVSSRPSDAKGSDAGEEESAGTEWEGPLSEQAPVPPDDDDDDDDEDEELATAVMTAEEAKALAAAQGVALPSATAGPSGPAGIPRPGGSKDKAPEPSKSTPKPAPSATDSRFDDSAYGEDEDEPATEEESAEKPSSAADDDDAAADEGSAEADAAREGDSEAEGADVDIDDGAPASDEAGEEPAPREIPAPPLAVAADAADAEDVEEPAEGAGSKKAVIIGGLIGVIVLVAIIVVATSGGEGDKPPSTTSAAPTTEVATTSVEPTTTSTETTTESTSSSETETGEEDAGADAEAETTAAPTTTAPPPPRPTGGGKRPPRKDKPPPRYVPDDL